MRIKFPFLISFALLLSSSLVTAPFAQTAAPANAPPLLDLPESPRAPAPTSPAPAPVTTSTTTTVVTTPVTPSLPPVQALPEPIKVAAPAVPAAKPALPEIAPAPAAPVNTLPTVTPPVTAPVTTVTTTTTTSTVAAPVTKEVDKDLPENLLFAPVHIGQESMMFNKRDFDALMMAVDWYDRQTHAQKTGTDPGQKDDFSELLKSFSSQDPDAMPPPPPPPLQHLYLGSIVYYSPSNWSVWINGKKIVSRLNTPDREFFVKSISDRDVVLVWKPVALLDVVTTWQQATNNGQHPLANVTVNEAESTITLHMHTNQTFLPRSLTIQEGLITSDRSSIPVSKPAAK